MLMDKQKKIVITGAGGYIGTHVVRTFLDIGFKVTAVDLNVTKVDNRAEKISIDIFTQQDIYEKLNRPDICLHIAWKDGFIHNAESHIINLPAHFEFINQMLKGGLTQIAVLGTMHEIGYWEGEINENTPTNPTSYYGIAKNSLRQLVEAMTKDKNIIHQWYRAFYITGDDLYNNSIFSKILKWEMEGKETFPFTTGENKYDFLSVDELAKQILMSTLQSQITGIINCCSGTPVSLRDKVENFIENNHLKIRPNFGAFPDRPYDSPGIWGDNKRIKEISANFLANKKIEELNEI